MNRNRIQIWILFIATFLLTIFILRYDGVNLGASVIAVALFFVFRLIKSDAYDRIITKKKIYIIEIIIFVIVCFIGAWIPSPNHLSIKVMAALMASNCIHFATLLCIIEIKSFHKISD